MLEMLALVAVVMVHLWLCPYTKVRRIAHKALLKLNVYPHR